MINLLLGLLLILTFFFSGNLIEAVKKFLKLITNWILKILALFNIKVEKHEQTLKVSDDFKNTYKEITKVKLSKKNLKAKSSIDWLYLIVFIIFGILYLLNLKVLTNNMVSNWLYTIVENIPLLNKFVVDSIAMNTFYTATIFTVLTFSLTKVWNRWKETKKQRIEAKQARIKMQALNYMDSKELVDAAKEKDKIKRDQLRK